MSAAEMKAIRKRKCILILMKNRRQCSDTNVQSRWQSKLYMLLGAQRLNRISAEAFPPKILRHEGDIRALLFLRQEVASQNRAHAEHIKIVRGQTAAEDL